MTEKEALRILKDAGALMEGHFVLSSGKHTEVYVQCASVFRRPAVAEKLCESLAAQVLSSLGESVCATDVCVVSPALGGIILGYELARCLRKQAVFVERTGGTAFAFRRGFSLRPGQPCIVAEDVVTTGGSVREVIELVGRSGGEVVAVACLLNRSGSDQPFSPLPLCSLLSLRLKVYEPDDLPPHLIGVPALKHGSRPDAGASHR